MVALVARLEVVRDAVLLPQCNCCRSRGGGRVRRVAGAPARASTTDSSVNAATRVKEKYATTPPPVRHRYVNSQVSKLFGSRGVGDGLPGSGRGVDNLDTLDYANR